MADTTAPLPPAPRSKGRIGLAAAGGGLAVAIVLGVVYAMGGAGKAAAVGCDAAAATAARLDPLAHGEVAALSLTRRPKAVPALAFTGPDGQPLSLADFKGRTVLLNLWATWCIPCRKEMPALDRLQGKLGGPDFTVLAVNVDTARLDRPKAFLKEAGIANLGLYTDPTAAVFQTLRIDGQALGLPTTVLIDPKGCQIGAMSGPAVWDSPDAEALIEAAKAPAAAKT